MLRRPNACQWHGTDLNPVENLWPKKETVDDVAMIWRWIEELCLSVVKSIIQAVIKATGRATKYYGAVFSHDVTIDLKFSDYIFVSADVHLWMLNTIKQLKKILVILSFLPVDL